MSYCQLARIKPITAIKLEAVFTDIFLTKRVVALLSIAWVTTLIFFLIYSEKL